MFFRVTGLLFLTTFCAGHIVAQINCPPHLPLTLLGNTSYCIGSSGTDLSIEQNYTGYEWLPTSETGQSVFLTAGNYEVVVTHYTGCTDTLAFVVAQVSNPPQPTINVSGPTEFCEGGSVTLSVDSLYPYYDWSTGSVSEEITVFESGTYNVSVTDWIGCSSASNSIQITVNPLPTAAFSPGLNLFDVQFNNFSLDATDYEWNFGDGSTSTDFEPTHTFSVGGTVPMYLVASNSCGSDTAFLDLTSVSVEEQRDRLMAKAFPNPSNGQFQLSLDAAAQGRCTFTVADAEGRILESFTRSILVGPNRFQFDLTHLSSGLYFLSIQNGEHSDRLTLVVN